MSRDRQSPRFLKTSRAPLPRSRDILTVQPAEPEPQYRVPPPDEFRSPSFLQDESLEKSLWNRIGKGAARREIPRRVQIDFSESSRIVTGPSLTSSTSICA